MDMNGGTYTKNFNTSTVTSPNFNFTGTLPAGEKVAYIVMGFDYGGIEVSGTVNIRCDTISSGSTTTGTAKIKG